MAASDPRSQAAIVTRARAATASATEALAAGDIPLARRWFERAHRIVPHDPNTILALASVCLGTDPARAAALFARITETSDVRQAWLGLAAAHLHHAGPQAARNPLAQALSRHALSRHGLITDTIGLANQIGGWCGLRSDGQLAIHPASNHPLHITLDGKPLKSPRPSPQETTGHILPPRWTEASLLAVTQDGVHLLGSPIQIRAIRRIAGCVEAIDGGLYGWAWHPGDPDTNPTLTLTYADGQLQTLVATDESQPVPDTGPLARPRTFRLRPADLRPIAGPIHVRGPDGIDILGSPLDPNAESRAQADAALQLAQFYPAHLSTRAPAATRTQRTPIPVLNAGAPIPPAPIGADTTRRPATIVIPIHNGGATVLACLGSVLATTPPEARILLVDDGSTDPAIRAELNRLAKERGVTVLRHPRALGFPASANAGFRAARGRDVVLLNSDTLLPPNWLQRLRDAAYSAPDIGTVTPLSNDASILSYPSPARTNPRPTHTTTTHLDRLAAQANGTLVVDIPVGVGFCLYLRRDCLNAIGAFCTDLFAQGYGEENDLCMRARRLGWRSVALTGLFVGHVGGASFGPGATHLRQRNARIIERLHPGHDALIQQFIDADPLAPVRRRMDLLLWKQRGRSRRTAAILITHDAGGGIERRLAQAVRAHEEAGRRAIILRPAAGSSVAVHDGLGDDLPNLIFSLPAEMPALLRLMKSAGADRIEAHDLAGYAPVIYDLIARFYLPYDIYIHNYAWLCPRLSLVAANNRYCGEPDLADCEACIADNGHFLNESIGVAALRQRSSRFLAHARNIIVPADDVALRIRRYFPDISPHVVPHDISLPNPAVIPAVKREIRPNVCVAGAIGVHKGYEILLACARDASRRDLDLEFVVVGHTIDDARLLATGRVFVTGEYKPLEAVELIAAQQARIGFLPSICPETWCFSLTDIWQAGLDAVSFDIGAPAERIKRSGRGIVLPLGLSANAINNALVAAIRVSGH